MPFLDLPKLRPIWLGLGSANPASAQTFDIDRGSLSPKTMLLAATN